MAKGDVDPKFVIDAKKAKPEELQEALNLLAKKRERQDKIKRGEIKGSYGVPWSEMTPEQKSKAKKYAYKRLIRQTLLIQKAAAAGITISDKEVDAEIARRQKK